MKSLLTSIAALSVLAVADAPAQSRAPESVIITRNGAQAPTQGSADYFTGRVRVDPLFQPQAPARTSGGLVTFEPGARSAWHTHPLGQTLFVTAGKGWVQEWGRPKREINPGDVVWIPPSVKHWHGAGGTTALSHIALQEAQDGKAVDWLEHVSDAQYGG
jgi:quercetin dioxygenase-like cupin family protein